MRDWAADCSISASACFSSDCFSWTVRRSMDPSNSTTTSPGFTTVPLFTILTICSSPAFIGEASTTDLSGRISPRISSVSTNSPFVTSAVGRSGSVPPPAVTNTPTTAMATTTHVTTTLRGLLTIADRRFTMTSPEWPRCVAF